MFRMRKPKRQPLSSLLNALTGKWGGQDYRVSAKRTTSRWNHSRSSPGPVTTSTPRAAIFVPAPV